MIKIGIIGGTSFAAGELCRLLLNHPEAEIVFVNSERAAGKLLTSLLLVFIVFSHCDTLLYSIFATGVSCGLYLS